MSGRDEDDEIQGAEDRVLESLLSEVIGGARPPDVSAAVFARLRSAQAGAAQGSGTHPPGSGPLARARRGSCGRAWHSLASRRPASRCRCTSSPAVCTGAPPTRPPT